MKNFLIAFVLLTFPVFAQHQHQWDKVIAFEKEGQTKSADRMVQKIYRQSVREKNEAEIIKCFFYSSKYLQLLDEDAKVKIMANLEHEISRASIPSRAILELVYAKCLTGYLNVNRTNLSKRTPIDSDATASFLTWSATDFKNQIEMAYGHTLQNPEILKQTKLSHYESIFDFLDPEEFHKQTLYEYLLKCSIEYWSLQSVTPKTTIHPKTVYGNTAEFISIDWSFIENPALKKTALLYQELEKFAPTTLNQLARLQFWNKFDFPVSDDYLAALNRLQRENTDRQAQSKIRFEKAVQYDQMSTKTSHPEYKARAIAILDSILVFNDHSNVYKQAKLRYSQIDYKSLSIEVERYIYPLQHTRIHIRHKNVDSLKISYFKISNQQLLNTEPYSQKQDSLIQALMAKIKPAKVIPHVLSSPSYYFEYTTEILQPQLETGNYLIWVEANTENKEHKTRSHGFVTVSNLAAFCTNQSHKSNTTRSYLITDRKSGKAIPNASLKTEFQTFLTNQDGLAEISLDYLKGYNYNLTIIKDNDTLTVKNLYAETQELYERKDHFIAKIELYTDRAIYRPGQTVCYKGIALQKKDFKTSVVPNLKLKLEMQDDNGDVFHELEATTNAFGSFSGEFVIPTTGIMGQYHIEADEPDDPESDPAYDRIADEHPFWDEVDLQHSSINFSVEEYKRPKFEVVIDPINQAYLLDQNIKISGSASSFAGSKISDAAVRYTIVRETYRKRNYWPQDENTIATGETKTDASGKFKIEFLAENEEDEEDTAVNNFTYHYTVKVDVTDINGETRSAEQGIRIGSISTQLSLEVPELTYTNRKEDISFSSENLNGQSVTVNGEIKVYFLGEVPTRFKASLWAKPEIETISRSDFQKLFPYEQTESTAIEPQLVHARKVNTATDNKLPLHFIANYRAGFYKIVFTAKDHFGKDLSIEKPMQIIESRNPVMANRLLTLTQTNADAKKDGYAEISIRSTIDRLYLQTTASYRSETFFSKAIMLQEGKAIVRIPMQPEFEHGVKIGFQTIFENEVFTETIQVQLNEEIPTAIFETETFRSKIEPGSTEKWSFKLTDKNRGLEAEILASMYDASLDQFARSVWYNPQIDQRLYNNWEGKTPLGFEKERISTFYLNDRLPDIKFREEQTRLIWFGFNFAQPGDKFTDREYAAQLSRKAPKNAKLVYGIATDASGLPIPGVNVLVKGTERGVQSDFDGYYQLMALPGETLQFSFLGMKDESVIIGENLNINMALKDDSVQLEGVVVTALGISKDKKALGYATTSVTTPLTAVEDNNIFSTLSGKTPGIQIQSGLAGSATKIIIRGSASVTGNGQALIVIDGVVSDMAALEKIVPSDLISTSILKDAAATGLYGMAGANGVLLIVTKKSIADLTQVKARKNLAETAFFYPNLLTDKNGRISFSFTAPEALTQWKMRLLAHQKSGKSYQLLKTTVTQKDLMVVPNFPRFLREKDTITVSAKIANITSNTSSGVAMLQLFDAVTMASVDDQMGNADSVRNFKIDAFGNTVVSWRITVPVGLSGLQYKVLAKAGHFTDGEENLLPVLSNDLLVTESIPVWVREHSSKSFVFENFRDNVSPTLRHHQFALEYTSNPAWMAVKSLPYLMEYEHECAEQTFARFYANALAAKIIADQPKIATLFEQWRNAGKTDNRLEQNDELKSILLAETPWFMDAKKDSEKKKNLALLFDLEQMKMSQQKTFNQLIEKQTSSGGFAWFDGGNESEYITRHIVSGLGHLKKLGFENDLQFGMKSMIAKGIGYIDSKQIESYNRMVQSQTAKKKPLTLYSGDLHYWYARSFFLDDYPLSEALSGASKSAVHSIKTEWLDYSLYSKVLAALTLHRLKETESAQKILVHLKETAANNEEWGMYWMANTPGWYWHQAPIETQALLIEAFAEISNDTQAVDAMKVWLLKNKQTSNWPTTKSTTEAIYALLLQGSDWTSVKDNTVFEIGDGKILSRKLSDNEKEAATGYLKLNWKADEIKKEMAQVTIRNKTSVPGYGGLFWQYFESLDHIKSDDKGLLSVSKELYRKTDQGNGPVLERITSNKPLKVGDLVTVRIIIATKEEMEYVHLKDLRAACFEPVDVLSAYKWKNGLGFYQSTRDAATHFFFDHIRKGTYILEYDIRVNNSGFFSNGITTIQSMYAPEFTSHSQGIRIQVAP